MDPTQRLLFADFPRAVGSPEQHMVHTEAEFDAFCETVMGSRNAYATVSWFPSGEDGRSIVVSDKVSYDFDSAAKDDAFPSEWRDDEKIEAMRDDPDLAEKVLGDVCDDVQRLVRASYDEGIPTMGVFSGFGIHVHQLHRPRSNPAKAMGTTARYWREELGLTTLDHKPIGDAQRIMRIPNMKRVHLSDALDYDADRWECPLFTIPLSHTDMMDVSPEWLLEESKNAKLSPAWTGNYPPREDRPEMQVYGGYVEESQASARPNGPTFDGTVSDEGFEWLLRKWLQMPCIYENLLLDPEPPHEIRVNAAVLLFNLGFTPEDVVEIFAQIAWSDWDREVTRKHVEHIYRKGYSDMNCSTLQNGGFCTRSEEPKECETFGWSGGECGWKR